MATDPNFTISDVLAWARTKPADEGYNFDAHDNCALCRFLRETGRAVEPSVIYTGWGDGERPAYESNPITKELNNALGCGLYGDEDWTFGALADRLAALLPAEPVSDTWTKADAYGSVEEIAAEFAA